MAGCASRMQIYGTLRREKQICYACLALRAESNRSVLTVSACQIQLLMSLRFFVLRHAHVAKSGGSVKYSTYNIEVDVAGWVEEISTNYEVL